MSYQVLARKWRPQNFGQLVGQDHVKAALTNALTQNRLHHAYLFTGTRGVGKTTIARIFAKSLNCEQGVTATPCGVCSACVEIDKGYFVDLLEIDAASRTKVEDTRDLLDNVQYAPSRGRYKVYLIDEVHMLSKHSFNALLKTLEEPPPHVKFLLATTDPQKLPITVLSRCLQFSLKALSQSQIKQHLAYILGEEKIAADDEALALLARAAKGSLRDSLSLTDQAIAQTNGHIELGPVREMLGYLEQSWAELLLQDVLNRDLPLMQQHLFQLMAQHSQVHSVLDDMLALLHLAALCQFQLSAAELALTESAFVRAVAKSQSAEAIQLYYQLLLSGKKDLPYAPDPRTGIEMALLRAIAFVPATQGFELADNTAHTGRAAALSAAGLPAIASNASAINSTAESAVAGEHTDVAASQVAPAATEPAALLSDPSTLVIDPITASIIARRSQAAANGATDEKKPERQPAPVMLQPVVAKATATPASTPASNPAPKTEPPASTAMPDDGATDITNKPIAFALQDEEADDAWQAAAVSQVASCQNVDDNDEELDPVADSAAGNWAYQQYHTDEQAGSDIDEQTSDTLLGRSQGDANGAAQPIRHALLDSLQLQNDGNTDFSAETVQPVVVAEPNNQPLTFDGVIDADNFAVKTASQIDPWASRIDHLAIGGLMRLFLLHASAELQNQQLCLRVMQSQRHLDNERNRQTLTTVLSASYEQELTLDIEFCEQVPTCPVAIQQRIDEARTIYVAAVLAADPLVLALQQHFGAQWVADSLLVN